MFPGDGLAYGPMRFDEEVTEAEARAQLRLNYKLKRLPAGTEVWPHHSIPVSDDPPNIRIQFT